MPGDRLVLDDPVAGRCGDALALRGWASVAGAPCLPTVEADGHGPVPAAVWPRARPDVARAVGGDDAVAYGFEGWVDLSALPPGPGVLRLRAGDAETDVALLRRTDGVDLQLDAPVDPGEPAARLVLRGWARGRAAPVLGVRLLTAAGEHETDWRRPRADVARSGIDAPYDCGFAVDVVHPTVGPVALLAVDAAGGRRLMVVDLPPLATGPPRVRIEEVRRTGEAVRVTGHVLWSAPTPADPQVELLLDGRTVARAPAQLSRPRVPGTAASAAGVRCGFVLEAVTGATPGPLSCEVRVTAGGTDPRHSTVALAVGGAAGAAPTGTADALLSVADDRTVVLDWGAGLDAALAAHVHTVMRPPAPDAARLPYADRSVDVVVVADAARLPEGRRVARRAVLAPGPDAVVVEQLRPRDPAPARGPAPAPDAPAALLVTAGVPADDRDGTAGHALFQARALRADGWRVTVVAERARTADLARMRALAAEGIEVLAGPSCTGFDGADHLERRADVVGPPRPDLAILAVWSLAELYLPLLRARAPEVPVVVDMIDLHLLRLVRARAATGTPLDGADGDALARELNAYAAADVALCVSDVDRAAVDLLCSRPGLARRVPLVRAPRTGPRRPFADRRGLLFVGNYEHAPNVDGLEHLLDGVLPALPPELLRQHPVRVVGHGLTGALAARCARVPGVEPVGWVPDLAPYLDEARLLVAPLRNGAGVKNKLLDALVAGTPCVTTPVGIEGTTLVAGQHVDVGSTATEIAAAVTALVQDEPRWSAMAQAGVSWMAEHHRPESARRALREAVALAVARRRAVVSVP